MMNGNRANTARPGACPVCIIEDTYIAGVGWIKDIEEDLTDVRSGSEVYLEREKDNYFDKWAIGIRTSSGSRIGYLSCEYNEIVSRFMDGGMRFLGKVRSITDRKGWKDIRIKVMAYVD